VGSDNSSTGYVQQIVKLLSVDNNVWPLSAFLIYIYTHTYIYILPSLYSTYG